jgi:hypothetical protein
VQIELSRSKQEPCADAPLPVPACTTSDAIAADEGPFASAEIIDESMVKSPSAMRGRRRSAKTTLRLPIVLAPGARLMREWNGRHHFVDVVENGYVFDGMTYRSLSAVAKRITGAHWSGPRFFGL